MRTATAAVNTSNAKAATDALVDSAAAVADEAPALLSQAADQIQAIARRSLDRARDFGQDAREKAARAGDATLGYIKDEPVKAVLIAATAGAVVALLVRALTSRRGD